MVSLVKHFGAIDGVISIKNHFWGNFGFNGFLDQAFLFVEAIWHDVQKGSWYILSSVSSQTLEVSPANNYLVDLWPNPWCNNYKASLFLDGNLFIIDISFISPKSVCFLCVLCGNVTIIFSSAPKYTV